ncbi:MAG: YihY/virulence factor BrkB family protein [Puniceicoccaceae bacterium]
MATKDKGNSKKSSPGWAGRRRLNGIVQFLDKDIWDFSVGNDRTLKGQWFAFLRILSISIKGLAANRLFTKAAALSYSSLIALGPLIAVIVVLSSSFIQTDAEFQIKRALLFIAPSVQEMVTTEAELAENPEMATALDSLISQIVEGAESFVGKINTGGSKTFGLISSSILIWVIIQLLTSVETTLNQIWGVNQGRPWSQRIVFYWTFISLGALLGLGSTALFSASNIAGMFEWFPLGREMAGFILFFSPLISFGMLVLLLTLFYRFFPHTSVNFKPALIGSLIAAALLFINNYLSILYVHRVISIQSLYGSVGIIPVMMIGLYFFWVLILFGGQITYAVQNVSYLGNQKGWQRVSPVVREVVALSVFLRIARRFNDCERAPTMNSLSEFLRVPGNILNESLELLEELGWITRINLEDRSDEMDTVGYRPAKPLDFYNLSRFKTALKEAGQTSMLPKVLRTDPILRQYNEVLRWHENDPFCQTSLRELLSKED